MFRLNSHHSRSDRKDEIFKNRKILNLEFQAADSKIDTVKSEMQAQVKEEVKEVRDELKKFQEIFLEQQRLMREMQEGTVSDVKDTRKMLHDVQKQTLELIDLQKGDF